MNKLGISSACYYPLVTEESLIKVGKSGIHCAELFVNSPSELKKSYIDGLLAIKNYYDIDIVSVHPFMSFAESYYLFSNYERRFYDILDLYRAFFEEMNILGADIFVIHGAKIPGSVPDELYFERFAKLMEIGKEYNINVCQENIVHYRSQDADFIKRMKDYIGPDFGVVLDVKQARRTGISPYVFIDKLGTAIKHLHISDFNDEADCIPPCEGRFNFRRLFNAMKALDYKGSYIIELYNHSYKDEKQIKTSYDKISKILIDY